MKFLDCIDVNPKISLEKGKIVPFIEMGNVSTIYRNPVAVERKPFDSGVKFQDGDTVVARITPCLQNGKRFYCKNIGTGFGSTEYLVFRPKNESIDNLYLYYFMKTEFIKQSMINSMVGATGRQRVNNDVFKSIEVNFPNKEKQREIGKILSAYDDLIENNQKQIKLLEEAAQRLYKEWFVDLRFPGYETTPIIDGVPEGWVEKNLSDIAEVVMGQSPKSEFYNKNNEGLPFHQGVANFGERFVLDDIYTTSFNRTAKENSILFSVRAPVGRINITKNKIAIGRGLAAINHKGSYQSFLFYLLKERFFKDNLLGNGSIFASISKDELLTQKFVIPSEYLVKKYNQITENIDLKIYSLDTQIKILVEARDRLLPKLTGGELEV